MAAITELTEDFTTPADAAQITTDNSIFDNISGSASTQPTCTTSNPLDSTQPKSCRFVTAASDRICRANFTAVGMFWVGFYFYIVARPVVAPTVVFNCHDGDTTKVMDLRLTAAGALSLRRDGSTTVWTSSVLALNVWHRIAFMCDPGATPGLRLRIYSGANLHGTTPSQDSTLLATTIGTNITNIRLGVISPGNETLEYRLARLRADDAVEPAALPTGTMVTLGLATETTSVWPVEASAGGSSPISNFKVVLGGVETAAAAVNVVVGGSEVPYVSHSVVGA